MLRKIAKWIAIVAGLLVVLLILVIAYAAIIPIETDPVIADAEVNAGSDAVEPAYSGLQRSLPEINEPADNPLTEAKAELGRQLFFDPILSENNEMSCATCHHPDLGFSNGQVDANGRSQRNVPSLWNVAYSKFFHWDGSVDSLETQALIPLTHADEMNGDPAQIVAELQEISAYTELFGAAFDSSDITIEQVQMALASFQRTLISNNSPFDQFAEGNFEALTPQQRRGLTLFRSGATRCFECHGAPIFALDSFRVIGVESDDPGRAGVVDDGVGGAFKVPTLRNVALNAPYMHNGSLETLDDVVQFYADGGGHARGAENMDAFVNGFALTEQERSDLVAFLAALTDETQLPEIPETTLSGLPTIVHVNNRGRTEVAVFNIGAGSQAVSRENQAWVIRPEDDAQAILDQAIPGDTLFIEYGLYNLRLAVDVSDLTIEGIPNAVGEYPIFDGESRLSEAFIASGNNFIIGNLHIRNYTDNGILVEGSQGVHVHDIISENTGTYGIYPVKSTNVLIERVKASGVNDAAIYAGQCRNVVIRENEVFDSVLGIECENTIGCEINDNRAYNNSLGIFVPVLPQLQSKASRNTRVYNNLVQDNNLPNFAEEHMMASMVPAGIGILSLGADDVEVYNNTITGHRTAGIAVFGLTGQFDNNEIDVGPNPDNNHVHDNQFDNNGFDPVEEIKRMGIPMGDLVWDGSGWDNRFDEEAYEPGFPVIFPSDSWPRPLRKVHWQALQLLIQIAG